MCIFIPRFLRRRHIHTGMYVYIPVTSCNIMQYILVHTREHVTSIHILVLCCTCTAIMMCYVHSTRVPCTSYVRVPVTIHVQGASYIIVQACTRVRKEERNEEARMCSSQGALEGAPGSSILRKLDESSLEGTDMYGQERARTRDDPK